MILSSCSNKSERSKVVLEIDNSIISDFQKSSVSAKDATSGDGPGWGLNDPQSLADISCFGIFVGAKEKGLNESSCTSVSGEKIKFGPRAGFFSYGGKGEIFVPAGSKRTIYLLGMRSSDGSCEKGFDKNTEINFSNYSNPFVIGSTTADLTGGENVVEVVLKTDFPDSRKITTCNFFDDSSSGDTQLSFTHYDSKRTIWVKDNALPRTVAIHHNGESVECSNDGGATFSSCPVNAATGTHEVIWSKDDYDNNSTISVKATYADGSIKTNSFTPSSVYPGLEFVDCTGASPQGHNFTQAPGTYSLSTATSHRGGTLGTIFGNSNRVVCLADGIVIDGGGTAVSPSSNSTIIVRQGHTATLDESSGVATLDIAGESNVRIIGLKITNSASGGISAHVRSSSTDIEFQESVIESSGTTACNAINISASGVTGGASSIRIKNSEVTALVSPCVALNMVSSSESDVTDSTITSPKISMHIQSNSILNISESQIINNGENASKYLLTTSGTATITANGNTFIDQSGGGIKLNTSINNVNFEINNNDFKRTASATSGDATEYITAISGSGVATVSSTNNGNFFCHASGATISSMIDVNITGNFTPAAQLNGTSPTIDNCP